MTVMQGVGKMLKRSIRAKKARKGKVSVKQINVKNFANITKQFAKEMEFRQDELLGKVKRKTASQVEKVKAFKKDRLYTGKGWKNEDSYEMFKREKKTYNEKISRKVKKYTKRFGLTEEEIYKTGMLPRKITATWADITSRKELKAVMNAMSRTREGKMAKLAVAEAKQTTIDIIQLAYYPDMDQMREIADIVNSISMDDIMDFRLTHPDLVRNFFLRYRERMSSKYDMSAAQAADYASIADDETSSAELSELIEVLRQYKK